MSIISLVPACNEADTLGAILEELHALDHLRVLVVDDGSTDGTGDVARRFSRTDVLSRRERLGYGQSLIDGFAWCLGHGAELVATLDADGQHRPSQLLRLREALTRGIDIVSGSRYLPDSAIEGEAPCDRRRINRAITAEINTATGWALTDAFCGFKLYRSSALAKLHLSEPGYGMPLELWARAFRSGLHVIEAPVDQIYVRGRSFGGALDDPEMRITYYRSIWARAMTTPTS